MLVFSAASSARQYNISDDEGRAAVVTGFVEVFLSFAKSTIRNTFASNTVVKDRQGRSKCKDNTFDE